MTNSDSQTMPSYRRVGRRHLPRFKRMYQEHYDQLCAAWHLATHKLIRIKKTLKRGALIPDKVWPGAYNHVWSHYDLYARAVLFLLAEQGEPFSRKTLARALDDSHGLSDAGIDHYIARYPAAHFGHYCDLSHTDTSNSKLRLHTVHEIEAFTVVPKFCYLIRDIPRSLESHGVVEHFVTVRDERMLFLDIHDYDEVLEVDHAYIL